MESMSDVLAFSCSVWRSPRQVDALERVGIRAFGTIEALLLGLEKQFVRSFRLLSACSLRFIRLSRTGDPSSTARGAIAMADSVVNCS